MNGFITYDGLPVKSGGAHHLGSKSPEIIFNSICDFINRYTNNEYLEIHIDLLKFSWKNIYKYSLKFGIPSFDLGNFLANRSKRIYWKKSNKELIFSVNEISKTKTYYLGFAGNLSLLMKKIEKFCPASRKYL